MSQFDLSFASQSQFFFQDLKIATQDKLIDFSKKHTNLVRFSGLPIVLCSLLLDLAHSIASMGESLIKGFANVFGASFSKKCSLSTGVKQIFLQTPARFLEVALGCVFVAVPRILITPIKIFISPTEVFESGKETEKSVKEVFVALHKRKQLGFNESPILKRMTKFSVTLLEHIYT